ncbi:MAG: hydroxypyruvate isomerase family protein [Planctomycetaceae bacterium]
MTKPDSGRLLSRRALLGASAALSAGWLAAGNSQASCAAEGTPVPAEITAINPNWKISKGRINQSVVSWCFNPMPMEELARASAQMGIKSVELIDPKHWPMLKSHGLTVAIASSHGFVKGWNHRENHPYCEERVTKVIEDAAAFGCKNVITFSGMRGDLKGPEGDEAGKVAMVEGLKKVAGLAEKKGVTLCIEMLNSRVDIEMKGHPGYQCDTIEWAVDVCERLGSSHVKILFDVYHVQIMQGDVITRLKKYQQWIGHYHTAGVPGRNELTDTQEINYRGVMNAIAETGYKGFVGQEFIPTIPDKIASLRHGVYVCDV